jgi:hypothetical protein
MRKVWITKERLCSEEQKRRSASITIKRDRTAEKLSKTER